MSDERMQPVLDAWFREREVAPRDIHAGVDRVMVDVPRTRQQGRWWPLLAFDSPRLTALPSPELARVATPATNRPTSARGFTMFSALKFIAASAIVALFGGFLIAGVLTTPQGDDMAPAAVTASPSPMTTEELLSGMVTEEVQPGVLRVVNDGVRDLASVEADDIVAGDDGGIWLRAEYENLRLGSDGSHQRPLGLGPEDHVFEVATDGTMWAIPNYPGYPMLRVGAGFRSTDGEVWTSQPCPGACYGVTVAPDGTVWASWRDEDGRWWTGHLGPTGWQALDGDGGGPLGRYYFTDAGDVYGAGCDWVCWLSRYEDGVWQETQVGVAAVSHRCRSRRHGLDGRGVMPGQRTCDALRHRRSGPVRGR